MKTGILIASVLGVFSSVTAQTYDYGSGMSLPDGYEPASNSPVVVEALPTRENGSVPYRMEIRKMKADKYKWDLFILALSSFQSIPQDNILSYYQIAGIHGMPVQTWNGVQPFNQYAQSGYCPHDSVLFPTWHRPYLALFESQLYQLADAIADSFPDGNEKDSYKRAAADIRLPYWDWSIRAPSGQSHLPEVFWNPTMKQYGPNGNQIIANPLYSYKFHPVDSRGMQYYPWNTWAETARAPTGRRDHPTSSNTQVSSGLNYKVSEIQQRLYAIFSSYHQYNSFATKAWASQNGRNADSVEALHDMIHYYGGSNGHMAYIPVAAFDPLFFIHHAQTDRLTAMWQVLNPDSWIESMQANEMSYTYARGASQDSSSALYPFMSDSDGTFWDSDEARTTEAFGYTYADTDLFGTSQKELRKSLIKKINAWYGQQSPARMSNNARRRHRFRRSEDDLPQYLDHQSRSAGNNSINVKPDAKDPHVSQVVKNNQYTEWVTKILVNTEALDGKFQIQIFVGKPPQNHKEWETASNLVGSVAMFSMNRSTGSNAQISGVVQLTSAMVKMVGAGKVAGLEPQVAVPFLKRNLHFTILGSNDKPVDPKTVDGLDIEIMSADVETPANDEELPTWGESIPQLKVWPQ